ncbi:MAG TPA: DUF523 and DUF1722 domain-containing protein [bacterium]|nr:DUF523 and DUF1722 domain-containing protein [bacterium]
MTLTFPKPSIVVSRCIEFDSCRYNGAMISSPVVASLKQLAEFTAVCPEVEIGLGVPRDPIRVVAGQGGLALVQPTTGLDLTARMERFTGAFLGSLAEVDGFILKSRSPSCGTKDVKIYSGEASKVPAAKGAGSFGGRVVGRFPDLAVEDEGRLMNFRIREHFLTRIFTLAAFREVAAARSMRLLVEFQATAKLLLMAYNQKEMRLLGRIVANPDKRPLEKVITDYDQHLRKALVLAPRYTSCVNVLMHALGYFSEGLSSQERAFFLDSLETYRQGKLPLSVPVGIIKSYIVRFDEAYLQGQRFFRPYPDQLVEITDSGKGRDL